MWLSVSCDLEFEIALATPFVLMLRPRSGARQWIAREEYRIVPEIPVYEFTDSYGNLCQRLVAPPGAFAIHTSARVMTAGQPEQAPGAPFVEIQHLPDQVLCYLLPSRYCESDRFGQMAAAISAGHQPGYDQVLAIERWLRSTIRYVPGSSNIPTSAAEVSDRQSGVCRDLAHLGIALCRSLSIPARFVMGYLHELTPMDLHAWFEAYVAGSWYPFDATQATHKGGYVSIGYGRDAADVATYNQFGPAVYPLVQRISVELAQGDR
jgi:transglutaminase-like putative cysteine protease